MWNKVIFKILFFFTVILTLGVVGIYEQVHSGPLMVLDDIVMSKIKGGGNDRYCSKPACSVTYNQILGACELYNWDHGIGCYTSCRSYFGDPCSGEVSYIVEDGACSDCANSPNKNCTLVNSNIVVTIKEMYCAFSTDAQGCVTSCGCSTRDIGAEDKPCKKCSQDSDSSC